MLPNEYTCTRCGETKPTSSFTPRKDRPKKPFSSQCKECSRRIAKARRESDWDRHLDLHFQRQYSLTIEEYKEMLDTQGGVCYICKTTPKKRLVVDHCHITRKIRGLLCGHCNTGLGYFQDDPARLQRAIEYLEWNT